MFLTNYVELEVNLNILDMLLHLPWSKKQAKIWKSHLLNGKP